MNVIYNVCYEKDVVVIDVVNFNIQFICCVEFDELFVIFDVVFLYCLFIDEICYFVDVDVLVVMKKIVYFVNIVCGVCVDEVVLVEVFKMGVIVGVGLDVFEEELMIIVDLLMMENVVLLFYFGLVVLLICEVMSCLVVCNIVKVFDGKLVEILVE